MKSCIAFGEMEAFGLACLIWISNRVYTVRSHALVSFDIIPQILPVFATTNLRAVCMMISRGWAIYTLTRARLYLHMVIKQRTADTHMEGILQADSSLISW